MDYLLRIDEVDPAEAAEFPPDLLVVLVVYYAGNPSDYLAVPVFREPVFPFTDFESPVLARSQGVEFHRLYLRHIILVTSIQLVGKPDEASQVLPASHFLDGYCHIPSVIDRLIYKKKNEYPPGTLPEGYPISQ